MGGIVWLASYPKSGNTWLRAVLTNYLRDDDQPADINALAGGPIAAARELFDDETGLESSDLTPEEIERYRPEVYRGLAANSSETIYLKIHDACLQTPAGSWLAPADATRSAAYIVRNPLDVAVSYTHHTGRSLDQIVDLMADEAYIASDAARRLEPQLRQRFSSWSRHVRSWVDQDAFPVHVMRFEDMLRDPQAVFGAALEFLGFPGEPRRLDRALAFSDFRVLQALEQQHGFSERLANARSPFFRQGQAGGWRAALTPAQAGRIVGVHAEVMRRFGYLTAAGEIAC